MSTAQDEIDELKRQLSETYDLLALAEQRNRELGTQVRASQAWAKSNLMALELAIADLVRVIDILKAARPA